MNKNSYVIISAMLLTAISVKMAPDVAWPILWAIAGTAIIAAIENLKFRM